MDLTKEKIEKTIILPEKTIKDAMKSLSSGVGGVLFVVNQDSQLVGTITDGDIRRAILSGVAFNQSVVDVMFKFPRSVSENEDDYKAKAEKFIQEEKISAVPVVDQANVIVDIIYWHEFLEEHPVASKASTKFSNPVVIMAGGKGTRLDPFTKILPKPLIPIGNKPIIEMIMDNFYKYGFDNFIVTVNYKKELIKLYFKENELPYNVDFIEEEEFLGTAGSLGYLREKIHETFYVCNCDIFLESNFRNILLWHKGEQAHMTLVGCHKEVVLPYGTLSVDNGALQAISEKPKFDLIINTGAYVLEPEILNFIEPGEFLGMNHLVERVMEKEKVTVFPIYDGWSDFGQWKEYNESLIMLNNNENNILTI